MRVSFVLVFAMIGAAACGGAPAPATKAAPAATVAGARPENEIATITLTAEAESRLGLVTAEVTPQSVALTRTVGGEAIVPPGQSVVVSAPLAGILTAVGDRAPTTGPIAAGAALFNLVPLQPSDRDAVSSAEREAAETDARLTLANQRLRRLEGLLAEGSVSARSVEEARADQTIAAAAAAAAKQRLATVNRLPIGARDELAITAPFAGEIIALHASAGQTVPAGATVAELARLDTLWVRVPLFAGDVASMDLTKPARVAALGHETTGPWREARRVTGPPSANLSTSSVDVFLQLTGPGGQIRPHERVSVQLTLAGAGATSAIVIPASAIVRDLQGGAWVYEVRAPHVFARRRVELGDPSSAGVMVTRGLAAGTRIVTTGAAELYGTEFFVSK